MPDIADTIDAAIPAAPPEAPALDDTLVLGRRPHLRRVAYALCGDWHQADDLLQTALVKLYVAWPRVRRSGSEDAYVRRILVRASIDEGTVKSHTSRGLAALRLTLEPSETG